MPNPPTRHFKGALIPPPHSSLPPAAHSAAAPLRPVAPPPAAAPAHDIERVPRERDVSGSSARAAAIWSPAASIEMEHENERQCERLGGGGGRLEVPFERSQPNRCVACGKSFQNHFSMRQHFQDVRL